MKTGIQLITIERKEMIEKHRFTQEHDSQHTGGELAYAATMCASPEVVYLKEEYAGSTVFEVLDFLKWQLPVEYNGNVLKNNFDCTKKQRIHQLKVAGALCAAEIDRIQKD